MASLVLSFSRNRLHRLGSKKVESFFMWSALLKTQKIVVLWQCATVQSMWQYSQCCHRSCNFRWSSATNLQKYFCFFLTPTCGTGQFYISRWKIKLRLLVGKHGQNVVQTVTNVKKAHTQNIFLSSTPALYANIPFLLRAGLKVPKLENSVRSFLLSKTIPN